MKFEMKNIPDSNKPFQEILSEEEYLSEVKDLKKNKDNAFDSDNKLKNQKNKKNILEKIRKNSKQIVGAFALMSALGSEIKGQTDNNENLDTINSKVENIDENKFEEREILEKIKEKFQNIIDIMPNKTPRYDRGEFNDNTLDYFSKFYISNKHNNSGDYFITVNEKEKKEHGKLERGERFSLKYETGESHKVFITKSRTGVITGFEFDKEKEFAGAQEMTYREFEDLSSQKGNPIVFGMNLEEKKIKKVWVKLMSLEEINSFLENTENVILNNSLRGFDTVN